LDAYLAADLRAYGLARWRLRDRFSRRPAHFQRLLRKSEHWTNTARTPAGRIVAAYLRLRTRFAGQRLGFVIPRNVFGPGLSIAGAGSIVVHHRARVGANCRIHHGVTIGEGRPGQYPAGSVVTEPVPDDVDVAGIPARIVRHRRPSVATAGA